MKIVPVPGAHVPSSILERLTHEDIVDTRQYRYIVSERIIDLVTVSYVESVVERIPIQYVDTIVAQDRNNWEIVAQVCYH